MVRSRRYHPLVADDLASAVAYFDGISVDLGNSFRTSVRNCIESITDRPVSFGCIHKELRAAIVNRFPYVIVFEGAKEEVTIVGLFHAASDRERWFERAHESQ